MMLRRMLLLAGSILIVGCTAPLPPVAEEIDERMDQGVAISEDVQKQGAAIDLEARTAGSVKPAVTASPVASAPKTITVAVDNWSFSPATITAKKGEKIQVRLTGKAGIHGFAIPELGINQRVEAGKTVTVSIPTDKAGTFSFFCSIPCGKGHREMRGTLNVQQ